MNKEQLELIDTMLEGFVQDIEYQFDLGTDEQALKLIEKAIERRKK